MQRWLVVVVVAGCAQGGTPLLTTDGPPAQSDGPPAQSDAPPIDAAPPIDSPIDATPPIDTPPPIDAPPDACVPMVTELLLNKDFDLAPTGVNWQQITIDAAFPPITTDGFAPQSPAIKVWLGGFEGEIGAPAQDAVYQDITIPAMTSTLVISGYYAVGTQETGTTVYDIGRLALTQTNGTVIHQVLDLNNTMPVGTWTPFTHTFAQNVSGMTVRVIAASSNDFLSVSNFFFDTLSLRATHGCP